MDIKGCQEKLKRLKGPEEARTLDYIQACVGRSAHTIDLSNHPLFAGSLKVLCKVIKSHIRKGKKFKHLILQHCVLDWATVAKVCSTLTARYRSTYLKTIDLANNRLSFTQEAAEQLSATLALNNSPKSLKLQGNSVACPLALQDLFTRQPTLKELNLYDCCLTEEALLILASVLADNVHIQVLDLGFNGDAFENASSVQVFAEAVALNGFLESLRLNGNGSLAEHLPAFCQGLASNRSLVHLSLASVSIGDVGVQAVCEMLAAGFPVHKLDLQHNQVTEEGLTTLLTGLTPSVSDLDLSYNDITESSALLSLASYLLETRSLRRLKISHSLQLETLELSTLECFGQALTRNDSLVEFYCEGVKLGVNPEDFCNQLNEAIAYRKLSLTYRVSAVQVNTSSTPDSYILRGLQDIKDSFTSQELSYEKARKETAATTGLPIRKFLSKDF